MKKERVFWGVFFILGAIFIVVSKLGFLSGINVVSLIFTVFLAAVFFKSLVSLEFGGIFFSLAFLAIIYDEQLQITALTPWTVLGAALFLTIGCSMIFGHRHKHYHYENTQKNYRDIDPDENFDQVIDEEDSERIYLRTSFGSSIKYVNSDNFKQADFSCSFGAMKIYFDNAVIQNGTANVNMDLSFGGVELYIPKEWTVVNNMHVTLAGVDEKNRNQPDGVNKLILNGDMSFAGITIIYV